MTHSPATPHTDKNLYCERQGSKQPTEINNMEITITEQRSKIQIKPIAIPSKKKISCVHDQEQNATKKNWKQKYEHLDM